MLKFRLLLLLLSLIMLGVFTRQARAINTDDWENIYSIVPFAAKTEDSLKMIATRVLSDGYYFKGNKVKYTKDKNTFSVTLKKPWHDITKLDVMFTEEYNGTFYTVVFHFAKGTISLFDVLNRYGSNIIKIKTDENLNKLMDINLSKDTFDFESKHPLAELSQTLKPRDIIHLKFLSTDKVYVDALFFGYYKIDKEL